MCIKEQILKKKGNPLRKIAWKSIYDIIKYPTMKGSKDPSTWKSTTPSKDCNILPCLSLSQATSWLKIAGKSQRTTVVGTSQTSSQAFPCAELGSMACHRLRLSHAYVCSAKPKNLPHFEYPQAFWPPRRQSHRQGLWQYLGFEASSRDGLEVGSRDS